MGIVHCMAVLNILIYIVFIAYNEIIHSIQINEPRFWDSLNSNLRNIIYFNSLIYYEFILCDMIV